MTGINFTQQNELVVFQGELTRETVEKNFEKKTTHLLRATKLTIDLAQVSHIDMAGLAWLLIMVEHAQKNTCELILQNLPANLLKLAKLSAVDSFLPIK